MKIFYQNIISMHICKHLKYSFEKKIKRKKYIFKCVYVHFFQVQSCMFIEEKYVYIDILKI